MTGTTPTRDAGDAPALDISRDEFLSQLRLGPDAGTVTQAVPPGSAEIHRDFCIFRSAVAERSGFEFSPSKT